MRLPKEEIARKLLHLFALVMPAGIFYLPKLSFSWMVPSALLGALLAGSVIIEKLRLKHPVVQKMFYKVVGSMLRKEEITKITGSTWVIGAALICSILFRDQPAIAGMVLTLFILGDAVAALVGMSMGRIKIGKKSLEGSLSCFTLCMLFFYFVFPHVPMLLDAYKGNVSLVTALATSMAITVFELVPLKISPSLTINDNLAVPVIAGMVFRMVIQLG